MRPLKIERLLEGLSSEAKQVKDRFEAGEMGLGEYLRRRLEIEERYRSEAEAILRETIFMRKK